MYMWVGARKRPDCPIEATHFHGRFTISRFTSPDSYIYSPFFQSNTLDPSQRTCHEQSLATETRAQFRDKHQNGSQISVACCPKPRTGPFSSSRRGAPLLARGAHTKKKVPECEKRKQRMDPISSDHPASIPSIVPTSMLFQINH